MGYADPDKQREFARKWRAARRQKWFDNHGPCRRCWSTENLQVYYPDRSEKVEHRIWTWKEERRDAELNKCIVLCQECWYAVRNYKYTSLRQHGTVLMYDKGGCRCRDCTDAHAANMRKYRSRGKMSSLEDAIKELAGIQEQIYREIDSLADQIEQKQHKIQDIETTIRTIKSYVTGNGHPDPEPKRHPMPIVPVSKTRTLHMDPKPYVPPPAEAPVPEPEPEEMQQWPADEEPIPEPEPEDFNPVPPGHRKCKRCQQVKKLNRENFAPNVRSGGGFISTCNKCNLRRPVMYGKGPTTPVAPYAGANSVLGDDFFCKRCRTKFMSQAALDAHNEDRHGGEKDGHICPVANCKKNFGTETDLENHIIHHHPKYARDYGYV